MARALRTAPPAEWSEVSLVFVDDSTIRKINSAHLSSESVTDVISFRYDPVPGLADTVQGEVFVNVQRALEVHSPRWSVSREVALYIAHGCDHLVGHDDCDTPGYRQMRSRELRWLREADRDDLVEGILEE